MANKIRPFKIHKNQVKKSYKVLPKDTYFVNYKSKWNDPEHKDIFNYFIRQQHKTRQREIEKKRKELFRILNLQIRQQIHFLKSQCNIAEKTLRFTKFIINKFYQWETPTYYFEYKQNKKKNWQLWIKNRPMFRKGFQLFWTQDITPDIEWYEINLENLTQTKFVRAFPNWTCILNNFDLKITLNILKSYNKYEKPDILNTIEDLYS